MKKLTAKKLYEKIVLQNYTPTDEERKVLEGSVWKHKLEGTTPPAAPKSTSFKIFYGEEVMPKEEMDKAEVSDFIVDKLEDRFGLHFSNKEKTEAVDIAAVKQYATEILGKLNTPDWVKTSIAALIARSDDVNSLMVRLCLSSG